MADSVETDNSLLNLHQKFPPGMKTFPVISYLEEYLDPTPLIYYLKFLMKDPNSLNFEIYSYFRLFLIHLYETFLLHL